MANVTRFDPFRLTAFDPFEDVFKGFFRPARLEEMPNVQIKMDVREDDKAYTVHAEIPGVKKEDIQVTIDGNQVSIGAECKQEKEISEGAKMVHSERYYGKMSRRFSLASEVDESTAEARYADGILELTLPKKAGTSAKKLDIH
jgi:HSP20 family protein